MLAIEVEYLLGRVHAATFRENSEPEWPPHPSRLFSALVAAHHDRQGTHEERELLLWLEQQSPPQIMASEAGKPDSVVTFVPTNYASKSGSTHPEQRGKQPRFFSAQGPASPFVYFVWPNVEVPAQDLGTLERLASRIGSLGRASSLIRARVVDPTKEQLHLRPNYLPDDNGQEIMAVASRRRLEELERTYNLGRRPAQGVLSRYRYVAGRTESDRPRRGHFGEMIVLRRETGIGFPIESTTKLTKRLREAFLSRAGDGKLLSPTLSGHDGEKPSSMPHVAFVALPNVGGEHSDGRLMGLAVVLPAVIAKADRRTALRACASIESINLGEQLGEWKVEIANFDVGQWTLKTETWMKAAHRWKTVTPILLDRFPKKNLSPEHLLSVACTRAGLPEPARCTYGSNSDLQGVPPVAAFAPSRWAVHATLEFNVAVVGPLLIGAGRFFGMGLMKPSQ